MRARWRTALLAHAIVFGLGTILVAKAVYADLSVGATLVTYGMTVTATVALQFFVALYRYRDPYETALERHAADPSLADRPLVSCLVAVFNEEAIVEQCVRSLCGQTYGNTEVIVVNDASTDGTAAVLDDLERRYPIKVIHLAENGGKKRALAEAILASSGAILAMTDSDSTWDRDAIARMVTIFTALPHVGAVSGHARALNAGRNLVTRVQDTWYEGQYSVRKAFESHWGAVTCVSGPLAVFRREAIYNYIPEWQEDRFLGREFKFATDRTLTGFVLGAPWVGADLKAKHRATPFAWPDHPPTDHAIVYTKAARALTEVPDTLGRVLKQQVRWKKSFIRNTMFTGRFYWRKAPVPALVYYLHVAFVLCGPVIVARHLVYLPLAHASDSALLYLFGNVFVGYMFGLACKREDPDSSEWVLRPLMSLFSTFVLSWLILYSALTIRKMRWHRG